MSAKGIKGCKGFPKINPRRGVEAEKKQERPKQLSEETILLTIKPTILAISVQYPCTHSTERFPCQLRKASDSH